MNDFRTDYWYLFYGKTIMYKTCFFSLLFHFSNFNSSNSTFFSGFAIYHSLKQVLNRHIWYSFINHQIVCILYDIVVDLWSLVFMRLISRIFTIDLIFVNTKAILGLIQIGQYSTWVYIFSSKSCASRNLQVKGE